MVQPKVVKHGKWPKVVKHGKRWSKGGQKVVKRRSKGKGIWLVEVVKGGQRWSLAVKGGQMTREAGRIKKQRSLNKEGGWGHSGMSSQSKRRRPKTTGLSPWVLVPTHRVTGAPEGFSQDVQLHVILHCELS